MRPLERTASPVETKVFYPLNCNDLPFGLTFALRRKVSEVESSGDSQSDGATTSNDGSENFDWITDD